MLTRGPRHAHAALVVSAWQTCLANYPSDVRRREPLGVGELVDAADDGTVLGEDDGLVELGAQLGERGRRCGRHDVCQGMRVLPSLPLSRNFCRENEMLQQAVPGVT